MLCRFKLHAFLARLEKTADLNDVTRKRFREIKRTISTNGVCARLWLRFFDLCAYLVSHERCPTLRPLVDDNLPHLCFQQTFKGPDVVSAVSFSLRCHVDDCCSLGVNDLSSTEALSLSWLKVLLLKDL